MKAYLSLGSNISPRRDRLEKAVELIGKLPTTSVTGMSDLLETEAEGEWKDGQQKGKFLNCCVEITTAIPPQRLLEELKKIEKALGRHNEGKVFTPQGHRLYADRPVDIDILLYGRRKIKTENLEIPHPRMQERAFVMIPLKQIKTN